MRLGRESLILVAVPVLLLGGAYVLLLPRAPERSLGVRALSGEPAPRVAARSTETGVGVHVPRITPEDEGPAGAGGGPSMLQSAPRRERGAPAERRTGGTRYELPGSPPERSEADDGSRQEGPHRKPFRGSLVDSRGDSVSSGRILVNERRNLFDAQGRPLEQASGIIEVGADGSFEIPRRPGYVYVIHVQADGYAPATVNLYAATGPHVTLHRPARVEGNVTDVVTGLPVQGAVIRLITQGGPWLAHASGTGAYTFDGVPAGAAFIEISHPLYRPQRIHLSSVPEGEVLVRNVALVPGAELTGRVVVKHTGLPPDPPVQVRAFDRYRMLNAGEVETSLDNGSFSFSSLYPGGLYVLTVESEAYGTLVREVQAPAGSSRPDPVLIELDQPWTLRGHVVDRATGESVPGARVSAGPNGGTDADGPVVFTDASGLFEIEGLASAGTYAVTVFHPSYVLEVVHGVGRESHEDGLEVALSFGGTVEGQVVTPAGEPVPGALIRIDVNDPAMTQPPAEVLYGYSSSDGSFLISGVRPGEVSLVVFAAGFERAEQRFLLEAPGTTVEREVVLTPSGESGISR